MKSSRQIILLQKPLRETKEDMKATYLRLIVVSLHIWTKTISFENETL